MMVGISIAVILAVWAVAFALVQRTAEGRTQDIEDQPPSKIEVDVRDVLKRIYRK